jgi:hypothetical protein
MNFRQLFSKLLSGNRYGKNPGPAQRESVWIALTAEALKRGDRTAQGGAKRNPTMRQRLQFSEAPVSKVGAL